MKFLNLIKNHKTGILALIIVVFFFFISYKVATKFDHGKKWCNDFPNREKAQEFFEKHNAIYLDSNGDGQACTSYRYRD